MHRDDLEQEVPIEVLSEPVSAKPDFGEFLYAHLEEHGVGPGWQEGFDRIRDVRISLAVEIESDIRTQLGLDPGMTRQEYLSSLRKPQRAFVETLHELADTYIGMAVIRDAKVAAQKQFNQTEGLSEDAHLPTADDSWGSEALSVYRGQVADGPEFDLEVAREVTQAHLHGAGHKVRLSIPDPERTNTILDGVESAMDAASSEVAEQWLIVKSEELVIREGIFGFMTASHEHYQSFLKWTQDARLDADDDDLMVLRILSDTLHDPTVADRFKEVEPILHEQALDGELEGFIEQHIEDETKGGSVGDWIRFIASHDGGKEMLVDRANWPADLEAAYGSQVGLAFQESQRQLRDLLSSYRSRRRLNDTGTNWVGHVRSDIDRGAGQKSRGKKRRNGRVTPKKVGPGDFEDELIVPERQTTHAARIGVIGIDGGIEDGDMDRTMSSLMKDARKRWPSVEEETVEDLVVEVLEDPRATGSKRAWITNFHRDVKGVTGLGAGYKVVTRGVRPHFHPSGTFNDFPHEARMTISVVTNKSTKEQHVVLHGLMTHDEYDIWHKRNAAKK